MPLSNKQMEYLALAWQCFDVEPKINYEKFAKVAGLASPHSARELMRVTKNKLKNEYGALSGGVQAANANTVNGTPKTPKTPKTPSSGNGKRKKIDLEGTPSKSGGAHRVEGDGDDDYEEEMGESVKKKGRMGGKPVKSEPVMEEREGLFE